jgi:hypothetical protein
MLAAIALIAFGCLALLNETPIWASVAFTGTVLILLIAVVGIVYREGERRASLVGASLFGWTYLLLSCGPGFTDSTRPLLAGTPILESLYPHVERLIEVQFGAGGEMPDVPDGAEFTNIGPRRLGYRFPIAKYFRTVGHSLFALVFAAVGSIVARLFYFSNLTFVRPMDQVK